MSNKDDRNSIQPLKIGSDIEIKKDIRQKSFDIQDTHEKLIPEIYVVPEMEFKPENQETEEHRKLITTGRV